MKPQSETLRKVVALTRRIGKAVDDYCLLDREAGPGHIRLAATQFLATVIHASEEDSDVLLEKVVKDLRTAVKNFRLKPRRPALVKDAVD